MVIKKEMKIEDNLIEIKKENRILNKKIKHIKFTLFNFRQKCYDEMLSFDNSLYLSNDSFNNLFDKLMNKFRKVKFNIELKGGKNE